jgi:DNA helicase HerA-like ATPase
MSKSPGTTGLRLVANPISRPNFHFDSQQQLAIAHRGSPLILRGATGTGKTKTLQVISEILSNNSVPVLLMDIKGDLSGIAAPGELNDRLKERCQKLNISYQPAAYPTELMTLNEGKGVRLRATVTEFGPVLLSKILGLNDTQGGVVAMIFKYCDDQQMPLLDLQDFIKVLQYVGNEGKAELEKTYGKISPQ